MKNLNALLEQYKTLSIAKEIRDEESVKMYLIRPMIEKVWGYDWGAGAEHYKTEVELPQIGSKVNHSRCDFLLKTASFDVVIEAKAAGESVDDPKHIAETASYVLNLHAEIGILTNGKVWCFFLADDKNVMEKTPFKRIEFDKITDDEKKFFLILKRPGNDLEKIRAEYEEGRKKAKEQELLEKIENIIIEKRKTISIEAKKEIIKIVEPDCTQVSAQKLAYYENFFGAALMGIAEREKNKYRKEVEEEMSRYVNRIETEELAIFNMVLGLLADEYDTSLIKMSDFDSGILAKIHFNGPNSGQPILWISGKIVNNKYRFDGVCFPLPNGRQGELIPLLNPTDILNLRNKIREEARISFVGPRFKNAKITESNSVSSEPESATETN